MIAIASREIRLEGRATPILGGFETYVDAVRLGGGAPVLLPLGPNNGALERCDGLLLVGGEDPASPNWWSVSHPLGSVSTRRDANETELIHRCREAGRPVLALCRGAQLVSCLAGGTLTRTMSGDCDHGASTEVFHDVDLDPGSSLAAEYGCTQIKAMSRHGATIATLGAGLKACAWAPDGTIEGFEAIDWPCLGILWHAEWAGLDGTPDLAAFRWLIARARSPQ